MTVLTWRDVASPDFNGVQDGFRNSNDALNSAFDAALKGVQKIDQGQTDRANANVLEQIAGATNGNAATDLLAHLASNPNASRLTAATINAAMARPGDLIKQASDQTGLDKTQYNFNQTKTDDANLTAATPDIQAYNVARDAGDDAKAHQILSTSKTIGALNPEQFKTLVGTGQDITKGNLSIAGTRQDQSQSATNFGNAQTDRSEERQATTLQGIIRQNGIEPADFDAYVTNHYQDLVKQGISPVVIEKARKAVLSDPTAAASFYQSGSLGGPGSGAAGGGDPSRVMNYEAAGAGFSSIPDSVQTLGQWSDYASGLNSKGVKSSAGGLFQITGDTLRDFGPKALGANWKNAPLTAVNQDKIGAAIYADASSKADPVAALRARWSSLSKLSDDQVRQLATSGWANAKNTIGKLESGAPNVSELIAQGAQNFVGQAGPQYNKSQDPQQVFATQMVSALQDGSDPRQVASRLTGQDGELAGEDVGTVAGNIKTIAEQYHVSNAAAGLILSKSVGFNKNNPQRAWDDIKGVFGGGDGLKSKVDWKQVDQLGKLAGNRDALIKQATVANINDASSQLAASAGQGAVAAQAAARARAIAAARLGRRVDPSAAIAQATQASDFRDQALSNAGAVTAAGGNAPPQAPTLDRHNVPVHTSGLIPKVTNKAQVIKQAQVTLNMGGVVGTKLRTEFQQKYGMTPEQAITKYS